MEKQAVKEQLSALLDNELDMEMVEAVLHDAEQEDALVETADIYLQIRDVLQEGESYRQPSLCLLQAVGEQLKAKSYLSVDLDSPDAVERCKPFTVDV